MIINYEVIDDAGVIISEDWFDHRRVFDRRGFARACTEWFEKGYTVRMWKHS